MLSAGGPDRELLTRELLRNGLPPPLIALKTVSVPFRLDLLPATDLLSFGPRQSVRRPRSGLAEIAARELSRRQYVGVFRRKDAYLPPVGVRFLEILKATPRAVATEP